MRDRPAPGMCVKLRAISRCSSGSRHAAATAALAATCDHESTTVLTRDPQDGVLGSCNGHAVSNQQLQRHHDRQILWPPKTGEQAAALNLPFKADRSLVAVGSAPSIATETGFHTHSSVGHLVRHGCDNQIASPAQ